MYIGDMDKYNEIGNGILAPLSYRPAIARLNYGILYTIS
jgi:hypothetical protein